jgi:glutamate synthase (NADPH/NADH) small chain
MASTCPKCHQIIEDDSVCCADVKYTWKCKSCNKVSIGFVVPYGRCYLCGGENEVIQGYEGMKPDLVAIVQEAMQYEVDMYHFYRIALKKTRDKQLQTVLDDLYHKEEQHLNSLEEKYHIHSILQLRQLPESEEDIVFRFIFHGIDFKDAEGHILHVYDRALAMEKRTRNRFLTIAESLPEGSQKELYKELAAEEEDHVAMLETEKAQFLNNQRN